MEELTPITRLLTRPDFLLPIPLFLPYLPVPIKLHPRLRLTKRASVFRMHLPEGIKELLTREVLQLEKTATELTKQSNLALNISFSYYRLL